MTAIERSHRAVNVSVYGPQVQTRVEWVRPYTYDKGDCVGGHILWVKMPDKEEYAALRWNAESGTGRLPVSNVRQQYEKDYPDLQWTPTGSPSVSSPAPASRPREVPPPAAPPPAKQPPPARPAPHAAEKPKPATPPAQAPCPPEPLPGVGNQETNLRCFGIP